MKSMRRFKNFACIDWSGARGERLSGLALATITETGPPQLLENDQRWSRQDLQSWLADLVEQKADIVIGIDLSPGLPFVDRNAYFPIWQDSPADAKSLWALVDRICSADPHLAAQSFVTHPEARRHFRHSKDDEGDLFGGGIGRLREVERHQRETKQANSSSCFNLIGASQVGKSSLTGMRMLHRLAGRLPVWPFDPIPDSGPLVVEIYTSMSARAAGLPGNRSKIRDRKTLLAALDALGATAPVTLSTYDDHATDVLLTAAWLRRASEQEALWHPPLMTETIRQTEGWTFGVL